MRERLGMEIAGVTLALGLLCAGGWPPSPARAEEMPAPTAVVTTLAEAVAATLGSHEAIEAAGEEVARAEAMRKRYLFSLTPDIDLTAGFFRQEQLDDPVGEGGPPVGRSDIYAWSASLSQVLYSGGRATAAYRGAREQTEIFRLEEDLLRRRLAVGAAEAFFGLLAAQETVRIGEQAVELAGSHLARARKLVEIGEAVATDRLRAEVNLAARKSDLVGYRQGLADARDRLERLCGRPPAAAVAAPPLLPGVDGDRTLLEGEAIRRRGEISQDDHAVAAAGEQVRERKGRFVPALVLNGAYGSTGDDPGEQRRSWQAGISLQVPIYQRAARFFELREARAGLRQAELRRRGRERDIRLEVRELSHALDAAAGRIESLRPQKELAAESLRLSRRRFDVGLADSIEVVDAQTALVQAEVLLTAETYRLEALKARMYLALGRNVTGEDGVLSAAGAGR